MEEFERKIQEKFKDHTSTEGVDSNELWDSIASEILVDQPKVKSPKKRSNRFDFWILSLVLIGTVVFGFIYFGSKGNEDPMIARAEQNNVTTQIQGASATASDLGDLVNDKDVASSLRKSNDPSNVETTIDPNRTSKTNEIKTGQPNSAQLDPNFFPNKNPQNNNESKAESYHNNLNSNGTKTNEWGGEQVTRQLAELNEINSKGIGQKANSEKQSTSFTQNQALNLPTDQSKEISKTTITPVDPFEGKSTNRSTTNQINNSVNSVNLSRTETNPFDFLTSKSLSEVVSENDKEPQSFTPNSIKIDRRNANFAIELMGGTNILKEYFTANNQSDESRKEVLSEAFKMRLGQHFNASVLFNLNENLFVSAGLGYQRYVNQFNYTSSSDSVVIRNDIFENQEVDATVIRTIVNHNKFDALSIPISIGYQSKRQKWVWGASAGMALNFTKAQKGITLAADDQLFRYPNTENSKLPLTDFYLSYHVQPFIKYNLNSKLAIQYKMGLQYLQFGKADYYGLGHSGFSANSGIGIIFTP